MLRVKARTFVWLCLAFLIGISLLLFSNKAKISNATVELPDGSRENIHIPFNSCQNGESKVFIYELTLTNSMLFSGEIQIIPDDCIQSIRINGQIVPDYLFSENNCDCLNGFYLNVKKYLSNGKNKLHLEVKNTHGLYGLNIRDTTFYERYLFISFLLFVSIFIRVKPFLNWCRNIIEVILVKHKTLAGLIAIEFTVLVVCLLSNWNFVDTVYYPWIVTGLGLLFLIIPIVYCTYKYMQYGRPVTILFLLATVLWLIYLVVLPYQRFSYDYAGHLSYVWYIIDTGQIPIASGGWMFYHPSLYYDSAAIFLQVVNYSRTLNIEELGKLLQGFSVLLFLFYIFISLRTIDLIFKHARGILGVSNEKRLKLVYLVTIALFLFWPSNSIFSVRIGNDMLFNLFYAVSIYFAVKWWNSNKIHHYVVALIFGALDVWAKTNGLITFAISGALFCYKVLEDRQRENHRVRHLYCLLALITTSIITVYFSFHEKLQNQPLTSQSRLIVGNANGLGHVFDVGNKPANFLKLSPIDFVKIPYTSSIDDDKGRQYFWFYLLKSSMFGEFSFDTPILILFAKSLSLLLFPLVLLFIIGLLGSRGVLKIPSPLVLSISIPIGCMILFRIYYPYSCSNDFRYIFPSLLPFSCIAGYGLFVVSKYRIIRILALLLVAGFIVISISFQIITILFI